MHLNAPPSRNSNGSIISPLRKEKEENYVSDYFLKAPISIYFMLPFAYME